MKHYLIPAQVIAAESVEEARQNVEVTKLRDGKQAIYMEAEIGRQAQAIDALKGLRNVLRIV